MDTIILKLEHEISTFINLDNGCTVHFEYTEGVKSYVHGMLKTYTASAYTINPKNDETFLLKSTTSTSKEGALKEILEYVKSLKGLSSFTVKWIKKDDVQSINTSYFYCHDVIDVVEKFFHGKNSDYIVYEIKLNPVS